MSEKFKPLLSFTMNRKVVSNSRWRPLAVADYFRQGDRMVFTHTEVPSRFRGHGIAEKLVLAGFDAARRENLKIVAHCSYVARVLQKHPEFRS